ncbi:MAG: chemotaxis protein CheX [Phycisphaeraceae bacterium]
MDPAYITPFIGSISNVFETMLQLPVDVGTPTIKQNGAPSYNVSGIIGMTGDVEGTVVLSFPTATAERAVTLFTGMELAADHEDFADAIGELVNMVSGGAKAQFTGKNVGISTPTVVVGTGHNVYGRKDLTTIAIPCTCDIGDFNVEVALLLPTAAPTTS